MTLVSLRKYPYEGKDLDQLTQLTENEPFTTLEMREGWAYVEALHQPVYTPGVGWHGYRGWIRSAPPPKISLTTGQPQGRLFLAQQLRAFLDVPYLWGGLSGAGLDCSGLIHLAFRQSGYCVPRDSVDLRRLCVPVNAAALKPADLLFFADGTRTTHVIAFLSQDRLIEAVLEKGCVREVSVEERFGMPLHRIEQGQLLSSGKRLFTGRLLQIAP